jgi:S-adenosylmethionine decarboxylase
MHHHGIGNDGVGRPVNDFEFSGTHVFCDISAIDRERINDNNLILDALRRGITESGATICGIQIKEFNASGLTAVYLLSESHVSVHTYPEHQSLFLDAFTCGARCRPQLIIEELLRSLGTCVHRTSIVHRGTPMSSTPALRPAAAPIARAS